MTDYPAEVQAAIDAPLQLVPLTVDELLAIWHGDEDTLGYHSEELVVVACESLHPTGPAGAVAAFYPGVSLAEVADEDRDMIERGYQLYVRRQSLPSRRRSSVAERIDRALAR